MKGSVNTITNELKAVIPALSINEGAARAIVSAFIAQTNPTIEELADIKCALSEAVTNCIVHAYKNTGGAIYIHIRLYTDRSVKLTIRDRGCGIADIAQARTPLFTTDGSGERSGMGFSVMESFCDKVSVISRVGSGTRVTLIKHLGAIKSSIA